MSLEIRIGTVGRKPRKFRANQAAVEERSSGQLSAPWPGPSHEHWRFGLSTQHLARPSTCFPVISGLPLGPVAQGQGLGVEQSAQKPDPVQHADDRVTGGQS